MGKLLCKGQLESTTVMQLHDFVICFEVVIIVREPRLCTLVCLCAMKPRLYKINELFIYEHTYSMLGEEAYPRSQSVPVIPIAGTCTNRYPHARGDARYIHVPHMCTYPLFLSVFTALGGIPRFLGIYPDFSVYPKALYRDFWVYRSLYRNVPQIASAYLCGRAHMYHESCCTS